ncbi:hypothetical protein ACIQ9P_21945 [Kitasatospora sp. NPDC094019]|uniref:hypothetical protein n=1 Tax=Kitasatospora sp. NPDC094019 TaxID=3364091 RepID=UPI0038249FD9
MPYELSAVIGRFDLLRSRTAGIRTAFVAPLRQSMGLLPVAEDHLAELTGEDGVAPGRGSGGAAGPAGSDRRNRPDDSTTTVFAAVEQALGRAMTGWARGGPIALVEADFHGGTGHQAAAVWENGAKVWGPVRDSGFTGPR